MKRWIWHHVGKATLPAILLIGAMWGGLPTAVLAQDGPVANTPAAEQAAGKGQVTDAVRKLFPADASYVGEGLCVACHPNENKGFTHTTHAKAFRLNPKNELERQGCESCHGPGSRHTMDNKDKSLIISFTREASKSGEKKGSKPGVVRTPDQLNSVCLMCHEGNQRIFWNSSIHQTNGVSCTDCHNPMAKFSQTGLLKKESISETCYSCHQQQRAEFRKRSHMPLPEGKMSCEDCHNPHGSATKPLLKADSINQLCYTCHQEKRGPFLWEHAPVRESCMNCHSPHGSNQEKLLAAPRPMLCQQCHTHTTHQNNLLTQANTPSGGLPDERVIGRGCSTCHAQIHGSNSPSGARLHR